MGWIQRVKDWRKRRYFVDSFTQELIGAPDAEILDGKDPEKVLAWGRALLDRAQREANRRTAAALADEGKQ